MESEPAVPVPTTATGRLSSASLGTSSLAAEKEAWILPGPQSMTEQEILSKASRPTRSLTERNSLGVEVKINTSLALAADNCVSLALVKRWAETLA
jgi:hypothetical protein